MSKGLGKVQIAIIRLVGGYPITGATYRYIRVMSSLGAQTLSRAIKRLCELEYIRAERPEWSSVEPVFYLATSKGLAAYAAIHTV